MGIDNARSVTADNTFKILHIIITDEISNCNNKSLFLRTDLNTCACFYFQKHNCYVIINMHTETRELCLNYLIKTGERVDKQKLAKEVITAKGGIAKSADFVAAGMRVCECC